MEEGKLNYLREKINEPGVLEEVAEKKIQRLKESFIEWLENEKETILREDRDKLVKEIISSAFPGEGVENKDEVRDMLNKTANRVDGSVREALEEMIKLVRRRLENLKYKNLTERRG